MAFRVLVNDFPHRTVGLATDTHVLVFHHTHSSDNARVSSSSSLPLPSATRPNGTPRYMVEFAEKSSIDLLHFRPVATAKGTLGLITLNNDVFVCVITGSEEVATVRPGETVQRIFAVEFCKSVHALLSHRRG